MPGIKWSSREPFHTLIHFLWQLPHVVLPVLTSVNEHKWKQPQLSMSPIRWIHMVVFVEEIIPKSKMLVTTCIKQNPTKFCLKFPVFGWTFPETSQMSPSRLEIKGDELSIAFIKGQARWCDLTGRTPAYDILKSQLEKILKDLSHSRRWNKMSGLWRPIVWSKSEKFWSFSHPSAPRNANALDGDKPTQSFPRRSCNIFRGWEMSELEENIREYSSRNWNDTWYIDFCFDGGK